MLGGGAEPVGEAPQAEAFEIKTFEAMFDQVRSTDQFGAFQAANSKLAEVLARENAAELSHDIFAARLSLSMARRRLISVTADHEKLGGLCKAALVDSFFGGTDEEMFGHFIRCHRALEELAKSLQPGTLVTVMRSDSDSLYRVGKVTGLQVQIRPSTSRNINLFITPAEEVMIGTHRSLAYRVLPRSATGAPIASFSMTDTSSPGILKFLTEETTARTIRLGPQSTADLTDAEADPARIFARIVAARYMGMDTVGIEHLTLRQREAVFQAWHAAVINRVRGIQAPEPQERSVYRAETSRDGNVRLAFNLDHEDTRLLGTIAVLWGLNAADIHGLIKAEIVKIQRDSQLDLVTADQQVSAIRGREGPLTDTMFARYK